MKNTTNSLFNKWGAGEQNPRGTRFMPTLSRTYGPGENPNTGRSKSLFESHKTSKKDERAAEATKKAKELRYEAESQVSDIKKAVDPGPTPVEPNRKDFANSDAGRRAYEFASGKYADDKAKFDRDMYKAAREKVLSEEKQMAMLRSDNLLQDPGKAPTPPAMSGNKVRDAKTLRKYEKELAAWKENVSAYLQQRTFLAKLLKEQEEKDDAQKSSTDTQKETIPKSQLDSIRQALSEKPSFSIGANKGSTFVRIDGDGGRAIRGISGVAFNVGKMWISQTGSFNFTTSTDRTAVAFPAPTEVNDCAYIRMPFNGSAPQWKDSSEYVDSDPTAEWYYVAETYGDIHVPRA